MPEIESPGVSTLLGRLLQGLRPWRHPLPTLPAVARRGARSEHCTLTAVLKCGSWYPTEIIVSMLRKLEARICAPPNRQSGALYWSGGRTVLRRLGLSVERGSCVVGRPHEDGGAAQCLQYSGALGDEEGGGAEGELEDNRDHEEGGGEACDELACIAAYGGLILAVVFEALQERGAAVRVGVRPDCAEHPARG